MDANDTNGNYFGESFIASQYQTAIGLYLMLVGTLGSITNSLVLATFVKFPKLALGSHSLMANLCLADLGICLFGFPFSASSSFANEWLYGDAGCQIYAFLGFLFGSASIGSIMMLALDRYFVLSNRNLKKNAHSQRYRNMLIAIWMYAIFWSVMPLIGWGRYNYEPIKTTCTIDWRHNDIAYKSYIMTYFILGFVLPIGVMIVSYLKTIQVIALANNGRSVSSENEWTTEMNTTQLSVVLVIAFAFTWSAYAAVCLWAVFGDPSAIPLGLTILPPLLAKASTIFNPLLYVMIDKRVRMAICSCLTGQYSSLDSQEKSGTAGNNPNKEGVKRKIVGIDG